MWKIPLGYSERLEENVSLPIWKCKCFLTVFCTFIESFEELTAIFLYLLKPVLISEETILPEVSILFLNNSVPHLTQTQVFPPKLTRRQNPTQSLILTVKKVNKNGYSSFSFYLKFFVGIITFFNIYARKYSNHLIASLLPFFFAATVYWKAITRISVRKYAWPVKAA